MAGNLTTVETAFAVYDNQLGRVDNYLGAILPAIIDNRSAVPVFVESLVVVMVARLEHFLSSLFAQAVHQREAAVREYFEKHGNDDERRNAGSCDRRALIQMVRRRITFKNRGKGIERMSTLLFGFVPWPSEDTQILLHYFLLLRNIFVHEGDRVLSEHATQARRAGLFTSTRYGDLTVYGVDYAQALILVRDATVGLKQQVDYIRSELLKKSEWTYQTPPHSA